MDKKTLYGIIRKELDYYNTNFWKATGRSEAITNTDILAQNITNSIIKEDEDYMQKILEKMKILENKLEEQNSCSGEHQEILDALRDC